MNTASHVLMGRFLIEYLQEHYDVRLNQKSFLLGNILPDYCPSFLARPHFLKNNIKFVQNTIRNLLDSDQVSASNDRKYSRHLGVVCHFYADFFCYAHSDSFGGNLRRHIAYENDLHHFFQQHYDLLYSLRFITAPVFNADVQTVYAQFDRLHSSYLLSRPSYGNDLAYAVLACVDALVLITKRSKTNPAFVHPYPDLKAV